MTEAERLLWEKIRGKEKDRTRDEYMKSIGLRVLRFSDREVFENIQGILEKIWCLCDS